MTSTFFREGFHQEELFHTFNNLYEAKKQMVFTCDRPISELKNITDRLSSRFERGLNVDLQPPNYETRVAILKKKLQEHGSSLSEDIINYIAFNVVTNVRDLESSLTKLVAYMDLIGEELTFEKAKQLLGILPAMANITRDTLSIGEIIKTVGDYFNVSTFEMKGRRKQEPGPAKADSDVPRPANHRLFNNGDRDGIWRSRSHHGDVCEQPGRIADERRRGVRGDRQ